MRLPKCNSEADVLLADEKIGEAEEKCGMARGTVQLHAMVETALGLENTFRIASACPRVTALTLGGQDFTADMGIQKTRGGARAFLRAQPHSRRGRTRRASPRSTRSGLTSTTPEGLYNESKEIVELGFTGKACIHPGQIPTIHKAFMPEMAELRKALRVVEAAEAAEREGQGRHLGRRQDGGRADSRAFGAPAGARGALRNRKGGALR